MCPFLLSVEIRLFHGIMSRAFQGPTHRRLWWGNMVYSGGNRNCPLGSQCLSSLSSLLRKKSNCVFSKVKTKTSVQNFILKLSSSEPTQSAMIAARPTQSCAPRRESTRTNGANGGHEQERELLCVPGIILLGFGIYQVLFQNDQSTSQAFVGF